MAIWPLLLGYLALDFWVFKGPLKQETQRLSSGGTKKEMMDDRKIIAFVFKKPIYLSQVDFAVEQQFHLMGKTSADTSPDVRRIWRQRMMNILIDEGILRLKVKANASRFPVPEEEIEKDFLQFKKRFTNEDDYKNALAALHISGDREMKLRLKAVLQQERYLQEIIKEAVHVSDEEAKQWYNNYPDELIMPERVHIRHIFIALLDHPNDGAQRAQTILDSLNKGTSSFAQLASEYSDDLRSKEQGGDLGWMRASRVEPDFAAALFDHNLITEGKTTIVKTKLGWHIVDLLGRKEQKRLSYEQAETSIKKALKATKTPVALEKFSQQIRAQHANRIMINDDLLDAPWTTKHIKEKF